MRSVKELFGLQSIKFILILSLFYIPYLTNAQNVSLSGTVNNELGEELIGATIVLKEITKGTATDIDGSYEINNIEPGTYTVLFSYIGYKTLTETITFKENEIVSRSVVLEDDALMLEEAVIIGYGTTRTKDLTGSAAVITEKDFTQGNITTPEQLVMGKIPGVKINSNDGAPGAGSRIRIRGGTSLNASNDPLIVIDGVPLDNDGIDGAANPLNLINPQDIENMVVLKDASAAAIYGSRGANGVIIITTKSGKASDKPLNLNFTTKNGISTVAKKVEVLTGDELRALVNEMGTDAQKELLGEANTDWQDEIFRNAFTTDNTLSASGNVKGTPYRFSLGYKQEQGLLQRHQLDRFSSALNFQPKIEAANLSFDFNARYAHTENFFADQGAIGSAVTFDPTQPVNSDTTAYGGYFEWLQNNGNPNTIAPRNPVGLLNQKDDESSVDRFIGRAQVEYKFHGFENLKAVGAVGTDISRSNGTVFIPETAASTFTNGGENRVYEQSKDNRLIEAYLNYSTMAQVEKSSKLDLTLGYSFQDWSTFSPSFAELSAIGDTLSPAGIDFETKNALLSFYGRAIYSLKDKYILTGTLRRDGSSRFGPDARWGLFPSAAAAWIVSDEAFLKDNNVLSFLKLRAGWGITGQQDISEDYGYIPNYQVGTPTAQYQFGNEFVTVLRPDGYDANLKWEETQSINAGIDFGFVNDRINGTLDFYRKETDDLLAVVPVVAGTNFTNELLTNVGAMTNQGIEASLNFGIISKRESNLNVGVNFSYNQNEITKLTQVTDTSSVGILVGGISGGIGNNIQIHSVGYPTFSFFVLEPQEEGGEVLEDQYIDQDGDGTISELSDRVRFENADPDYFLGFNLDGRWKKFYGSMSMRSEIGGYIYNNLRAQRATFDNINGPQGYLQNLMQLYFEDEFVDTDLNQLLSKHYIEKADFLRMDYITLGYNFGKILDKMSLNASFTVGNVFVLSDYSGIDPEVVGGIDNAIYPRPRNYSLNLSFDF